MSNTEMIRELRSLTQAGMKDCKDALEEAGWNLEKAVDIVKVKGLNVVSGREGKVASEGRVEVFVPVVSWDASGNPLPHKELAAMIEINCQTDFVAKNEGFIDFCQVMAATLAGNVMANVPFEVTGKIEELRKETVASTKENVVVRRWWAEEAMDPKARVFTYTHSNHKIGVVLTLLAPSEDAAKDSAFRELGEDLAMQVAAMNPSAVSPDRLPVDEAARQKTIFETQLTEMNKPQQAWPKILDGKFNKWYTEVCLMNQESVVVPKTSIAQVVKTVGAKLGGEIQVVSFIRCQVGEGIEKKQEDLANEVAKMM